MIFYHGTGAENWKRIQESGGLTADTFLTTDLELARRSGGKGADRVVLRVKYEPDPDQLFNPQDHDLDCEALKAAGFDVPECRLIRADETLKAFRFVPLCDIQLFEDPE